VHVLLDIAFHISC